MNWDVSLGWFLYVLQRIATERSSTDIYSTPVRLYIILIILFWDWEWCCCRCGSLCSPHSTAIIWSTTLRTLQEFQCMATSITTTQCLCWCHGAIGWCTEVVFFLDLGIFFIFFRICIYTHTHTHTYIYIYIQVYILNWSTLPLSIHPSTTSLICKAWHIAIKRRRAAKSICRRFVVVLACRSVPLFRVLDFGKKQIQDVVFCFLKKLALSWYLRRCWKLEHVNQVAV